MKKRRKLARSKILIVSVTDFGAKGGGADDTAAFKAAMRSKAAIIKIPGGDWRVRDIELDHRFVSVREEL